MLTRYRSWKLTKHSLSRRALLPDVKMFGTATHVTLLLLRVDFRDWSNAAFPPCGPGASAWTLPARSNKDSMYVAKARTDGSNQTSGMPSRSARQRDGRLALLDAGRALFFERGYAGVTMQQIAESAGMTKGAPYYHFTNKQELIVEVMIREVAHIVSGLTRLVQADQPFRERLIDITRYLQGVLASDVLQLAQELERHIPMQRRKEIEQAMMPGGRPLVMLYMMFARAHAMGEFHRTDEGTAFRMYLAMVFGNAQMLKLDEFDAVRQQIDRIRDPQDLTTGDGAARHAQLMDRSPLSAEQIVGVLLNGI